MATDEETMPQTLSTPNKSIRSFSDPPVGGLAPSPSFQEKEKASQDDDALLTTPRQPRRHDFLSRGLTLQLPSPRTNDNAASAPCAAPLSPKLEQQNIYMQSGTDLSHSPATNIPRHSRGLDFARACTNLHHSTLAEQSSPDSSPVVMQKGVNIPGRRMSMSSMILDSPFMHSSTSAPWGSLAQERSTVSSSVGSINMLASESESSDSDEDASMGGDDNEDPMFTTPQVHKLQNPLAPTPFNGPSTPGGSAAWGSGSNFSPAQASLMKNMRRARLHKTGKRSRKSSSSASNSGYSSMVSPRTVSPPPLRSIESATNGNYFHWASTVKSRRESLALGTDGLHLSSGNDSGDEASQTVPSTPGVVRRPVTRRGNLLPKTKGFARIRAALLEEAAPVDTEVRKEAETIRQVRERDYSVTEADLPFERPGTATAASSPQLLPAVPESAQVDFGKDLEGEPSHNKGLGMNFAEHATRNSGGMNFWNRIDPSMRTPPPPSFARHSSSNASDVYTDSPMGDLAQWRRPRARSSASDASEAMQAINGNIAMPAGVNDDMHLKKFKRRREDDFDIATIKRRAVSPGMSTQNSPVLTNSPSQRDMAGAWGQPPERKDKPAPASSDVSLPSPQGQGQPSRSGSGGSTVSLASTGTIGAGNIVSQGKKLGLQPMVDTNDGLMKMTIE